MSQVSQYQRFTTIDTPLGAVYITASGDRVVRIETPTDTSKYDNITAVDAVADPLLQPVVSLLEGFFRKVPIPIPVIERYVPQGSGFRYRAWEACARVPYGTIISYAELAARAGNPNAFRAAGSAMANNPLAFLIPCHRVVGADGHLNGYGGGLDMKKFLLELEGITVDTQYRCRR